MSKRPRPCKILREYQGGKTRATCRTHNWATRWLSNDQAMFAVVEHEKATQTRRGKETT